MRDRDAIYVAAAGKAIERGLMPERQGNTLLIRYPDDEERSPKEDHLHRQVLRNLIARLSDDQARVRTAKIEGGFMLELSFPVEAEEVEEQSAYSADEIVERIRELVVA